MCRLSNEMDRIALFRIIYFEETKYILVNFTNFPVFKNTIKRITFENRMNLL